MPKQYLIERFELNQNRIEVSACTSFDSRYLLDEFFVEYDENLKLDDLEYSILQIPFILNVIPIIWMSGEKYHIEQLDKTLASSLENIRGAFRTMYPNIPWSGELVADQYVNTPNAALQEKRPVERLAILYSGGVDSVCTSLRHADKKQLLISIWGPGVALENEPGWLVSQERCKQFARAHGHAVTFLKSNLNRFLYTSALKSQPRTIYGEPPNWWEDVQHGLGLIGLTAPVLRLERCPRLLLASTFTHNYQGAHGSHYLINRNLRWNGASVSYDSPDLTRHEKLQFINDFCEKHGKVKPKINVCFSDIRARADNCCRCEKCLRTITGLLLEGASIHEYGFNISPKEAAELVKQKYEMASMPTRKVNQALWEELQAEARQILSSPNDYSTVAGELLWYLEWLSSIDLSAYRRRYQEQSQPSRITRAARLAAGALLKHFPTVGRILQKKKEEHYYRSLCKR
jgi:hypothetical protein